MNRNATYCKISKLNVFGENDETITVAKPPFLKLRKDGFIIPVLNRGTTLYALFLNCV